MNVAAAERVADLDHVLPAVDLDLIARLAEVHQPEAVRALRTTLRGGGGGPST